MIAILAACAQPALPGTPTHRGLYRVEVARRAHGVEVLLSDGLARPVTDGTVDVAVDGLSPGVADPGECDTVGPERCSHPGGLYLTRLVLPAEPVVVRLAIDGPAGPDSAVRTLSAPPGAP